jgi:prephenate dehydrogenase
LGFIGGSIGLALHQAEGDIEVVGHDRERSAATQARKIGAVDKTDWNLISACEDADLIVMATPVGAIQDTLKVIAPYLKAGCLITDTATSKVQVVKWAEEILPEGVHFVGGDPVVGDGGGAGIDAARADLFSRAIYCLTPAASAAPDAVRLASDFVSVLGAVPYFLDPQEHDGLMAGVDHLPFVLSAALLGITTESATWREMRKLAGGVFEGATGFASADPMAYRDACLVNSENIVRWIDAYSGRLAELRETILARDSEKLGQVFEDVLIARQRWLKARAEGNWEGQQSMEVPTMGSFMGQLFGLGRLTKRRKQE